MVDFVGGKILESRFADERSRRRTVAAVSVYKPRRGMGERRWLKNEESGCRESAGPVENAIYG
jgi:hypothetical protein